MDIQGNQHDAKTNPIPATKIGYAYSEELKDYNKAYLAGDKKAAEGLALLYEINLNDYKKAESWYKKAIDRKSLDAVKILDFCIIIT